MAKNVYHYKGLFKSFLFGLAVVIAFGFLLYTYTIVKDLQDRSRTLIKDLQAQSQEFLNFKVQIFEENITNEEITDFNFVFSNVIQTADYPIIYTDAEMTPQFWRNIDITPSNNRAVNPDTLAILTRLMADFKAINPPIPISYQGSVLGYYFYGESETIRQLRSVESEIIRQLSWLPIFQIIVGAMFILIGYAGFRSIKKSEERFIWVGMAKETAHQLGTPLSSQIGWLEYLKHSPTQIDKVVPELEKDLERLQIITNRFSQIGSLPDMTPENLAEIISETVSYFRNRIPQKNGKIQILTELDPGVSTVKMNRDLFSWVLENLIKNGLDALGNEGGSITITTGKQNNSHIYIEVKDTGKGIAGSDKKNVFNPGFSTKKRGWGLGLSLAKRIVEDYHGGKLTLQESQVGVGSTFRISFKCV